MWEDIMDYCINCGADLADEMEKCPECGAARFGRRPAPFNPHLFTPQETEPDPVKESETVYVPQEPQEEILRDQPAPVSSGHEPGEPVVIDTALEDMSISGDAVEELPVLDKRNDRPIMSLDEAPEYDDYYDDPAYDVLSSGQYLGSLVLMSIPVIGWLAVLIWALGGTKNFNRRNLARGVLLAFIISVGLVGVVGFVLSYFFGDIYTAIVDKLFAIMALFQ
jgi:hypothetical protein